MRRLLNTLYITTPEAYLALEGEDIQIQIKDKPNLRIPLLNLENIVCFTYQGASPVLMGACADRGIGLSFLRPSGQFLARIQGNIKGNVLLRTRQYAIADETPQSIKIARCFLIGKIYNQRKVILRALRDHGIILEKEPLINSADLLKNCLKELENCQDIGQLMAFEGLAAKSYFDIFDDLILQQKEDFHFSGRNRRPPLDRTNALLSFIYTLLVQDCIGALETVGLDPYLGFLHQLRPGRPSLALDLMEELRPLLADRLVLSFINMKQVKASGFLVKESGAVLMDDETRKNVLTTWQKRKQELIMHPFTGEKIPLGLAPYVQALLLSRFIREDLDAYPPFLWR
ncbi:MAG: type I-C CRISPR-associated endonuclease Cas1c [Anaerolineaceae bacterium]|nr:type I-C CRISPR-associated endonuclease Cas1c [Anaerolineaceae bacterium]